MRRVTGRKAERRGFTLIELLVVIAIIGVLVSLLAAGVMAAFRKGPTMQNVNDIQQLTVGLETFKTKFGSYPPSAILLANNMSAYTGAPPGGVSPQLQQDSLNYLTHMFPRMDLVKGVNWVPTGGWTVLEGDQCLVFFLGGIIQNGAPVGFSSNPRDPSQPSTGEYRMGPYYNFDSTRLIAPTGRKAPFSSTFPVYLDVYLAKPYAYFSSGKRSNGYNVTKLAGSVAVVGDCPDLGVAPYVKNGAIPLQFYNPNTVQIISAGEDKLFGPGGVVPPGTGVPGVGSDDYSNLTGGRHGAGL